MENFDWMTYLLFVICIPLVLFILNFISIFLKFFFEFKDQEKKEIHPQQCKFEIVKRSPEIIGTYQGKDIVQFITISDGRTFEYESVAQLNHHGVYHSSEPEKIHILVDNLLYKLVSNRTE